MIPFYMKNNNLIIRHIPAQSDKLYDRSYIVQTTNRLSPVNRLAHILYISFDLLRRIFSILFTEFYDS